MADDLIKTRIKDAPIDLLIEQFLNAYILGDSSASGTGKILGKTIIDYTLSKVFDSICETQEEFLAAITSGTVHTILWKGNTTLIDFVATAGTFKLIYCQHYSLLGKNSTLVSPAGKNVTIYGDVNCAAPVAGGYSWTLNSTTTSYIKCKWIKNSGTTGKVICEVGTVLYERLESGLILETNGTPGSESYINQEFWHNTNANAGESSSLSFVDIDSTNSPYSIPESVDEIIVSTATADVVVTLPATSLKRFYIKWLLGAHNLTVNVAESGMIDGAASFVFNTKFSVGTSVSFVCKESGDWVANEISFINESNLVHKSLDETITGGKSFAKGAIFYGQNLELPTTVGNFIAAYTHPTYGPRVLAHNGTTYAPLKFGPMPTVNKFALDMRVNGDIAFGYRLILGNYASAPTGTLEGGMVYFNTTDHLFYGYDGSAWISLGGGGSSSATMMETMCLGAAITQVDILAGSDTQWTATGTRIAPFNPLTVSASSKIKISLPQPVSGKHFIFGLYSYNETTHLQTRKASTGVLNMPASSSDFIGELSSLASPSFVNSEMYYAVLFTDANGARARGAGSTGMNFLPYTSGTKSNLGVLTAAPDTFTFENETGGNIFMRVIV